mmetsp:Transcript_592/g.1665  ORF Transcript_592/g.1665 Transcript_592/m.1665 type:complete len:278 (+) Transcript_592:406-1239(+)
MEALDPAEREALRSMQAEAVASAGAPLECSPSEVAPSLSRAGADSVLREIRLQRGIDAEELGLGTAQEAERQSAAGVQSRIARLERSLREEEERPVQSVVDEVARKRTQEQLRAEIESLRKERSLLLAEFLPGGGGSEISKPFIPENGGVFESIVAPNVALRGKIDAMRAAEGELHIIEHKARVHKLFNKVREYEKVQCLGYIHLVQDHMRQRGDTPPVRCFLVETLRSQNSRHEVRADPTFWREVIGAVRSKIDELQALMNGGPSAARVLSWLERL